eukprot:1029754-Pelagomonas_calceolata.AAC.2
MAAIFAPAMYNYLYRGLHFVAKRVVCNSHLIGSEWCPMCWQSLMALSTEIALRCHQVLAVSPCLIGIESKRWLRGGRLSWSTGIL